MTLRQYRTELLVAGVVLGICGLALGITGPLIHHDYSALNVDCQSRLATTQCDPSQFYGRWAMVAQFPVVFLLFPVLAGMFFAAPLVASEIEAGTHHLVWTQSVTRTRWLATKAGLVVGPGILVGAGLSLFLSWWRQPFDELAGTRMDTLTFDQEGLVTATIFLFAISLGIAAGAVLRRILPAIAVFLLIFSVVRVSTALLVPHLMPAVTALPTEGPIPAGLAIARWPVNVPCPQGSPDEHACQVEAISVVTDAYFWRLQLLESGIYATLGAVLLWVAFYWVRRRIV